jgi:hypothetical protein
MGGDNQSSWGEGQQANVSRKLATHSWGGPAAINGKASKAKPTARRETTQVRAVTVWSVLEPSCLLSSSTVVTCRSAALRLRVETILFDRPESVTESVTRRESLKDATARRLSALVDWER